VNWQIAGQEGRFCMKYDQQGAAMRVALAALFAGMLAAAATGCVSSTLNTNDFRPVGGQTAASPAAAPQQSVQSQALVPQSEPQPLPQVTSEATPQSIPPQPGNSDGTATGSVSDPVKRQQAINEIRTKAAASSGQKTQIGALPTSATEQMSSQEQADIASRLENSRQAAGAELSDAEVEARKAAVRRLQQKGKTHYQQTLEAIEN